MADLKFLNGFKKNLDKMKEVSTDFSPPKHWYSVGNLAVNKIMSGSFDRGIPQGRITVLAGPSGSGKSFIGGNIIREAQKDGAFTVILDSENALDKTFLNNIGCSVEEDKMLYAGVVTIDDVTDITSDFISGYEKEYGKDNPDAPKVVMFLDSLDMLLTSKENDDFDKGVRKGDMGQRTKQLKHLLRTIVNRISRLNITFIATHQVYANQDILNGEGNWIINNSVKYSASQIFLITKLKLREGTEVAGIRMRVETYKSRFAKLGSKIEVEVPYAMGMNPYSGLLPMMVDAGIISQAGAWYTFNNPDGEDIKFQRKNLDADLVDKFLAHPILRKEEEDSLKLINGDVEINSDVAELGDETSDASEE